MTNRPLVSIIIPAYNVSSYVKDCLSSINNQTYDNIETIVINDGSSDNTDSVIKNSKHFSSIVYIEQDNRGVSASRNRGIDVANGEYLVFIDADDLIHESYVENLLNRMNEADISTCMHVEFKDGNTPIYSNNDRLNSLDRIGFMAEVFYGDKVSSGPHGKMFSKSIIGNVRFDTNLKIGEDLDFLYKIFLSNTNLFVHQSNSRLYGYRTREGSAMNSTYDKRYRDYHDLILNILNDSTTISRKLRTALDYRLFGVASFCLAISNNSKDNDSYMKSIKATKFSTAFNSRSTIKNRILAISYIINSNITNRIRKII